MDYRYLFQPLDLNGHIAKNRIMCAPMVFGAVVQYAEAAPRAYRKVEAAAKGGAGVVCVGETSVNSTDAERIPFDPIDFTRPSGKHFEAIKRYADLIRQHGALALIELSHAGGEKDPLPGEGDPWGPTGFIRKDGQRVQAMDRAMMQKVRDDFATAAVFMKEAGFDGVLVHAGHGWLFSQFLSPLWNKRTDEYGGSLEDRARFPIEVFRAIREAAGPGFLLQARVSGRDGVPGGIEAGEVGRFVHLLEGIIDSVHVSNGLYNDPVATYQFSSMYAPHGCNVDLAATIKSCTAMPVGVVGGINSPELAEEILAQGKADYVVLGRQMIADPELPLKARAGREREIRRCLRCYKCFPGSPEAGYDTRPDDGEPMFMKVGSCTINPKANLPVAVDDVPKPAGPRRVLVVGGGCAGMQAAITAADRGHRVTLVEQSSKLGGILDFADVDVDKQDLRAFKDMLIYEVGLRDVAVRLGTRADAALIAEEQPEYAILALGSVPYLPPIPGIEHAVQALRVYDPGTIIGRRVVMVGGGLVGCETGLHLAKTGHEVTVVEMLGRVANESFGMYREALLLEMERVGVTALTNTTCVAIAPTGIRVKNAEGTESPLEADSVVYSLGMCPNSTSELETALGAVPFVKIGDCVRAAQVDAAVKEGFLAAMEIL
ncbi:MAG: FAD-dependent oxidoreductase [Thermoleophilia bacterium]|nr:FAD-dependent oxidoreductase [Thermoleophilia bacterium]